MPNDYRDSSRPLRQAAREPAGHDLDSDRMTEGQRAYLAQLCEQAGEPFEADLSIAEAGQRIRELEQRAPHPS